MTDLIVHIDQGEGHPLARLIDPEGCYHVTVVGVRYDPVKVDRLRRTLNRRFGTRLTVSRRSQHPDGEPPTHQPVLPLTRGHARRPQ